MGGPNRGRACSGVAVSVAMAMVKCAKNTIETVWWENDESLFFSPCLNPKQELPQTEPLDAPCADTWAHPAPPRTAAPRHTTLIPFPRRMCLQAGGKLPCTAQTCLAFESKNAGTNQAKTHTRNNKRTKQSMDHAAHAMPGKRIRKPSSRISGYVLPNPHPDGDSSSETASDA